ncbi:MAG: type II toxin-antitoxin system PemK/MazF family toxin [Candidatus Eremiobacteraeota bacterium]|nr:type II toxin-antitoxin system PemK/MazF family toxin [Candidatus Eremiobacteraeota bacterium]
MIGLSRYRLGDVWLASYKPTMGSEISKPRPMVIVSPDEMNDRVKTVVVVPLSRHAADAPWRANVMFGNRAGRALCDQIRSVSSGRLIRPLGNVDDSTLRSILATLQQTFAVRG